MGGRLFFSPKVHALTDKDTIVLADFTNTTGDPVFDGTLRQGLSVQLEQSPFLSIVPDQQIQQTLQMMGQKPMRSSRPTIARELCQRTAAPPSSMARLRRLARSTSSPSRRSTARAGDRWRARRPPATDKNHVLDALGKTASEIRNKLGESLSTVQKFDTPLEQATTPSLEALKAYSSGYKVLTTQGSPAAIPFFKRAIEFDPNFAVAYAMLGHAMTDVGNPALPERRSKGIRTA